MLNKYASQLFSTRIKCRRQRYAKWENLFLCNYLQESCRWHFARIKFQI